MAKINMENFYREALDFQIKRANEALAMVAKERIRAEEAEARIGFLEDIISAVRDNRAA